MAIRLDNQAAAFMKQVQKHTGPVTVEVEQHITKACEAAGTEKALTLVELEKILTQAMPDQSAIIADAKGRAACYHPDKTQGTFLTQILETRIEKETARVYSAPAIPPRRVDPYYTDIQMDPRADFVLLFNARDVDRNGQPLLMKVVARERADLSKLDLSQYRTRENQTDITKFDIMKVANDADYIAIKDSDEMEFNFGDPLKQVTLDGKANELSTSVKVAPANKNVTQEYHAKREGTQNVPDLARPVPGRRSEQTGDQLDTFNVVRFDDRINLKMSTKDTFPEGSWLDDRVSSHLDISLGVDRGFFFEPGARGRVDFLGSVVMPEVKLDDAQMLGNDSMSTNVTAANQTMRWVLTQPVRIDTFSGATGPTDRLVENKPAHDIVFAERASISVGFDGNKLAPLQDLTLSKAQFEAARVDVHKIPLAGDAEGDGQEVHLNLKKGFLRGEDGVSVEGWKVVAGFVDHEGNWKQAEPVKISGKRESQEMSFKFDLPDADAVHQQNKNLEIRLYNAEGIPAERVLIPFRQVGWGV